MTRSEGAEEYNEGMRSECMTQVAVLQEWWR